MKNSSKIRYGLLLAVLCGLCASCSSSLSFTENIEDYDAEIRKLEARMEQSPNDAETRRDLGVIYARTQHPAQAQEYLQGAYERDDTDPKTMFYLGHVYEELDQTDAALRLYGRYPNVPRTSTYRKYMEGRFHWIVRQDTEAIVRNLVAMEDSIIAGNQPVSVDIIAVYPLIYQGQDERYVPLSRGFSEMIVSDLGLITRLQLVERIQLQLLLDELALQQADYIDPATRLRPGRLLGAGRLVGGTYNILDEDIVNLDLSYVDVTTNTMSPSVSDADALSNFFEMEKRMVFGLLHEMGIELTPAEKSRIELNIPTRNLQAFLAYSRGLQEEDQGNYRAAAQYYQQSGQLDPTFQDATIKTDAIEALDDVSGPPEDVLITLGSPESFDLPFIDLMDESVHNMNANLGASFVPGPDNRTPTQEAVPTALPRPPSLPEKQ